VAYDACLAGREPPITFDDAVPFYDETRGLSVDALRATTDLLASQFPGGRRLLDVGVGTGLLAVPLAERGFRVDGIDLSEPMLRSLLEKGCAGSIGVAEADATSLPFRGEAFDGAYLRHVLHLIPDWVAVLAEVVRVVRPGGRFVASITDYSGLYQEVQRRFLIEAGDLPLAVGLAPNDPTPLVRAMAMMGAQGRRLPPVRGRRHLTMERFLHHIERGHYTWTWPASEAARERAAERLRAWLARRYGDLSRPVEPEYVVEWWAFELPRRQLGAGRRAERQLRHR
jgi:ubiquinone/menaquinone biosynthesis C-methylase UbiE